MSKTKKIFYRPLRSVVTTISQWSFYLSVKKFVGIARFFVLGYNGRAISKRLQEKMFICERNCLDRS